jgi:hypothetical protein
MGNNNNSSLLKSLSSKGLNISNDEFDAKRIVTIGGLFGVNPSVVHRPFFQAQLAQQLSFVELPDKTKHAKQKLDKTITTITEEGENSDMENSDDDKTTEGADDDSLSDLLTQVPDFQLYSRQYSYGKDDRIRTIALAIECKASDDAKVRDIFKAAEKQQLLPAKTTFVRRAMSNSVGPNIYRNVIQTQQSLIAETVVIPVFGITSAALDTSIENKNGERLRLRRAILDQDCFDRVEQTTDTKNGKWFFVTTKDKANTARQFIDSDLPRYYKQLTKFPTSVVPGWPVPGRGDRHGDDEDLEEEVANLQRKFATAPTLKNTVQQRGWHGRTVSTLKFRTGDKSYAAATATTEPTPSTPEGKRRRKSTADVASPVHPDLAELADKLEIIALRMETLAVTIRADVDARIASAMQSINARVYEATVTTIQQELSQTDTIMTTEQLVAAAIKPLNDRLTSLTTELTETFVEKLLSDNVQLAVTKSVSSATDKIAAEASETAISFISKDVDELREELSTLSQSVRQLAANTSINATGAVTPPGGSPPRDNFRGLRSGFLNK